MKIVTVIVTVIVEVKYMTHRSFFGVLGCMVMLSFISACNESSIADEDLSVSERSKLNEVAPQKEHPALKHTVQNELKQADVKPKSLKPDALKPDALKPNVPQGPPPGLVAPNMGGGMICTMQYDPVCAKRISATQCITSPCPTHEYKTFGNACNASSAKAQMTFKGECQGLEGDLSFSDKPVRLKSRTSVPKSAPTKRLHSSISGHTLTVEVEYQEGCTNPLFDLIVSDDFIEGQPVTLNAEIYNLSVGECSSATRKKLSFDLMPLSEHFFRKYKKSTGTMNVGEFGLYSW